MGLGAEYCGDCITICGVLARNRLGKSLQQNYKGLENKEYFYENQSKKTSVAAPAHLTYFL